MNRKAQRVKSEIEIDEGLKAPLHIWPVHPVSVCDVLDHGPHAREFFVSGKTLEMSQVFRFFKINPAHNLGHKIRGVRKTQQIFGFHNRRCCLHQHGFVDAVGFTDNFKITRQNIFVNGCHGLTHHPEIIPA